MKARSLLVYLGLLLAAGVFFLAFIYVLGLVVRPDGARPPRPGMQTTPPRGPAVGREESRPRPIVIHRAVDYGDGTEASWHPRGESPPLAALVEQGLLPPVAQRVGEEPLVVEGVDGIGNYGGAWRRLSVGTDLSIVGNRLSYLTLVRWSPSGYPIVPHVAKAYEISDDNRVFTFHLRRGMKWSDGCPFTGRDILFWWEHIACDRSITAAVPPIMTARGEPGQIELVDDYTVKFSFPHPNGVFLSLLASDGNIDNMLNCPAHFFRRYHPTVGDRADVEAALREHRLPSAETLFRQMRYDVIQFPEIPRLWPWIYVQKKANPPQTVVRNPYYWMVDTAGNQLPYIDRIVFDQKSAAMIPIAAAGGQVTCQFRYIPYEDYTHLMEQRQAGGYEVLHWYPGDRGLFVIACNLNYKVDPAVPETINKHALLNDVRFRRALSLAINRASIIKVEYNSQCQAAQCGPGPASYFYDPCFYQSYTAYRPDQANQLLDDLGLTKRDYEGCRTFPDGSRMTFFLNIANGIGSPGMAQLVVDDWAAVGIRAIPRLKNRGLFYTEKMALRHDFTVWVGNSEYLPVMEPRYVAPMTAACNFAIGYARWYLEGGLYGKDVPRSPGCIVPPPDHPCRRVLELYDEACAHADPARQKAVFDRMLHIAAENVWTINVSTPPPVLTVVDKRLRNVPRTAVACWMFRTPGNAGMETFYFEQPAGSAAARRAPADDEVYTSLSPVLAARSAGPVPPVGVSTTIDGLHPAAAPPAPSGRSGGLVGSLIRGTLVLVAVLLLIMVAGRHPYICKRLLIMAPTMLVVSVFVFVIIQMPPGDYLTTRIMMLEEQGDTASQQELLDLRKTFYLDKPMVARYAHWLGLYWFATWDESDKGLLQGDLGRTMANSQPVNQIVGDRILLTVLISLFTIAFTWLVAVPVGIYSAVRQYSLGDYLITLLGFVGMSIPSFLLALLLMYWARRYLNVTLSGLFSPRFSVQPEWDLPKFLDMLKHIWLPVVVLGVGGTAGMIRIMRGNLLDELKKPYVITARAKGVRPIKLLLKYPVRLALNPFISGIGGLFPQLISGGAIVAMVLSLPTVGPLMLNALLMEDMYLAGSMLMVLSLLGVVGTLVSDILLLWLDPRIRYQAGRR